MAEKAGLLLDIAGIQNYIFGTNRLRQIVGASGNVRHVITRVNGLLEDLLGSADRITYAGGGNALVLFETQEQATEFARKWSLEILLNFPGVQAAAGVYTGEYSENKFGEFLGNCRNALNISKAENAINVTLPRYGITAECKYTGTSAQYFNAKIKSNADNNLDEFYSIIAEKKDAGYKAANKRFTDELGQKFCDNFEDLAGETGSQYRSGIAIVHIDGNDIGKMFSGLKTLDELKNKSEEVRDLFQKAVADVTHDIERMLHSEGIKERMGLKRQIFPFRPIIIGGDDVTYVCHASLGLWSAHAILKHILDAQKEKALTQEIITACAGIAFTKPSYPFAVGYELAEELCESAKNKRREAIKIADSNQTISFLDFHVLKGGAFSDLKSMREQGFSLRDESLTGRPFGIDKGQEAYEWLKKTVSDMLVDSATKTRLWPMNKIKELRETVYKGEAAINIFFDHMRKQGLSQPSMTSQNFRKELGQPIYLDICEFIDVYPQWLLIWESEGKREKTI